MALFGEEINGAKAVELGLAWEALDDAAVEDRAIDLAQRGAADPELARLAVGNFRQRGDPLGRRHVVGAPAQMWSMRRSAADAKA